MNVLINKNPYQGLKHRLIVAVLVMRLVLINKNPYQGLKWRS